MLLKFDREWTIGERIGEGGFGQVFAASSPDGKLAVAKMVPKTRGARELLFVELGAARNVVPIIDYGETEENYVLIMPRAEMSLRQHLDQTNNSLDLAEVLAILEDVALALADIDGTVVHRDLKPHNILLLNEKWCLADFGISRYAEAATATDTQKYALSPPYAAPERWRGERATSATDVYSFGVIAFELLTGSLPFQGPESQDFRHQHLHVDPCPLVSGQAPLVALIEECLFKAPEARPAPKVLLARLGQIGQSKIPGLAQLQEAHRAEVSRRGDKARRESEKRSENDRRVALVDSGFDLLTRISDKLKEMILTAAPLATLDKGSGLEWGIRLNNARMKFGPAAATPSNPWEGWTPPAFEVIAHTMLGVEILARNNGYAGRIHSLWYCDAQEKNRYEWFETAFMFTFLGNNSQNPFALDPGLEAAKALWNGTSEFQVAWPFSPLRINDLDEFIGRWAAWLADASQNRLQYPHKMPEYEPNGSWRPR